MIEYLVPGLIVSMAIIFLLVCLPGLHRAVRQEGTFKALLIKMKKEPILANRNRLIKFPSARTKAQLHQSLRQALHSGRRLG